MSGEIRRENFADEASWLEFQANQLELARHKRQRETAQKHAEAGRDYGIVKRINRKIKHRECDKRRYWANPDEARARVREAAKRYYIKHGERKRARFREWFAKNHEWSIQWGRWYRETHRKELNVYLREWRAANPERVREYNRAYLAQHRDKINAQRRARRARKRAERLAQQEQAE